MKGILITGGLGYIGGRIADYLRKKEPNVDIFLTTRNKNKRLPEWTREFTVLQMNLLDEKSTERSLNSANIDAIVHLAALNEIESIKNPELALEVNTRGTYKLLSTAISCDIDKFIYFSTFHVYGETSNLVISEKTPTRPFHPYAITHRTAEDFVTFFSHYYNMRTLIFRLSNAYGYPMDKEVDRWTLVFNDLCKQAVTKGRITLKSSGKQYRDFISLYDVARAVHHFIFLRPDNWGDGLYNLGGNCAMAVLEVAREIAKIYSGKYEKRKLKIETESGNNDSKWTKPFAYNIEKIMETGFRLKGNMEEEITRTMAVCEEFLNEKN